MKALLLALPLLLGACRNARAAPGEARLERAKLPPRLLAQPSYPLDKAELLPQELTLAQSRQGVTRFELGEGRLLPRRAYHLAFMARGNGGSVAVSFIEPTRGQSFRTYRVRITSDQLRSYTLDFTAPVFTRRPQLQIDASSADVSIDEMSLTEREPLPQTEPITTTLGSYVPEGYALVFNDEFSGTALDRSKWFTRYIYSGETLDRLNDENQRYADNENHRVSGGVLYLVAKRSKLSKPSGINYESGMIRSDFTLRYGFFEARVKMPSGLGVWPAFWLNSDVSEAGKLSHPPEIDFFELANNGKDDRLDGIHSAATKDPERPTLFSYLDAHFNSRIQVYRAPFRFSDGFHTIGGEWTPNELSVYVDGLKIYTRNFRWVYADGSVAGPAHVLLNLAIGGQWAGRYGIDDAAFPQALAVDWVRAYQRAPVP